MPTENLNITFDLIGPSNVKCSQYTLPTFCLASQGTMLINPATGRLLGYEFPFSGDLATSSPLPSPYWRPDTGTQLTEWSTLHLARRCLAALRNLARIAALPENWDTFGSDKAAAAALSSSRDLIWKAVIHLAARGVDGTPYDIAPLSGGGLQIEWRGGSKSIEVEVSANGHYNYLLTEECDGRVESQEADNVTLEEILHLISAVLR